MISMLSEESKEHARKDKQGGRGGNPKKGPEAKTKDNNH